MDGIQNKDGSEKGSFLSNFEGEQKVLTYILMLS